MDHSNFSKIHIVRTSQYTNGLRKFKIIVDGKIVDTISNGEEKVLEITPGNHCIQLKIDWSKSKKIDVQLREGEEIKLDCGSRLYWVINSLFLMFSVFAPFVILITILLITLFSTCIQDRLVYLKQSRYKETIDLEN